MHIIPSCSFWAIIFGGTIITVLSKQTTNKKTTDDAVVDSLLLSCGATADASDAVGRKWSPDAKFLASPNNAVSATALFQDPSLPSTVPYMTARIFVSKTSYKFPVSQNKRHAIRLHFYPSSYSNYVVSNSFFSVTSGAYTLLNNFSASITANAISEAYVVREFLMTKQGTGTLDLTFTPSAAYNNSFAFINGIEVISMPDIFHPVSLIGFPNQKMYVESVVMQTMFRLNIGGLQISANNDPGFSRTWVNDSPYIYGAGHGITTEASRNVTIKYPSKESESMAPADVYRTARTMGPNATVNQNYNLTWSFQIDANFTYLLRLHFCDFVLDKANQMVFTIYINKKTAEPDVDVIAWSGGKRIAVHKDYAMYMNGGTDDHLWVALHPNAQVKPEYFDAILNGLEIFKFNDSNGNLAGPNPKPPVTKDAADPQQGRHCYPPGHNIGGVIAGSVLGSLAGFTMVAGLVIYLWNRRKMQDDFSGTVGGWLRIYSSSSTWGTNTTSKSSVSCSRISNLSGGLCRHFSLSEIMRATDNFNEGRVIGVGGFGKVYKGFIDGNTKSVAIKRANPSSEQGICEFLNEIELLSKLRHRHLVSLIGACEENNEMILVYDYMANGTLREHLYNGDGPPLTWQQRLRICIGASKGIHYLHTGAKHTIIHRDVKSTNILLDEKWVAKVSDFGLSKTGHNLNQTHVSTIVKGSFGYLDPEYYRRQQLTDKSDVYSFGVVLLELLCGRPALSPKLPKEQVSLADWAILNYRRHTLDNIIDPNIKEEINSKCLRHFSETAMNCLSDHGSDRPSMGAVLWNLEYCLQLQNNPNGTKVEAKKRANDACAMHSMLSIEDESE